MLLISVGLDAFFQLCTRLHPPKPIENEHHVALKLEALKLLCTEGYSYALVLFSAYHAFTGVSKQCKSS